MQRTLREARERLVTARDTVSLERAYLVTEGCQRFEQEPPALCRAKVFDHLLRHMTLDLRSNPIFAGNTAERPRAWSLLPEYGFTVPAQAKIEHDWVDGFLDGDRVPRDLREFWRERSFGMDAGIGHLAIDLDAVVHHGVRTVAEEARLRCNSGTEEQRCFRQASAIACEAVMHWAERYRVEAEKLARGEADAATRDALTRVSSALTRVPAEPARDLFEALQAIVLVHLATALEGHGFSISLGLLDRVLAPFANEDEDAVGLFSAFLLKVGANSVWGSFSKTQAITLGGLDHQHHDQCNALTLACLEACHQMRLPDPHVFLRWHRDIDPAVKTKAEAMLAEGLTLPLLVGDEETAAGFEEADIAPEDAWRYCVIGCNELGIPGKLWRSAVGPSLNYAALLADVVKSGSMASMSNGMEALEAAMDEHLGRAFRSEEDWWKAMAERLPTPFTSAMMTGCLARGEDLHAAAEYPHGGLFERGLVNAVNGLAALEQTAFKRGRFSIEDVVHALDDDFADESLRQALRAAPKWGNDDPGADAWARRLLEMRERCVARYIAATESRPRLSCHVVRSLHWVDGLAMGATPDGRKAGQALGSSIGPEPWDARHGPTAALASVTTIPARRFFRGGYNLNLTLPPGLPENGLDALIEGFFAHGGQELQVSVLDPSLLREAMSRPAQHRDLLVRIAGFTGRFVDLSRREQEEILRRAQAATRPA